MYRLTSKNGKFDDSENGMKDNQSHDVEAVENKAKRNGDA